MHDTRDSKEWLCDRIMSSLVIFKLKTWLSIFVAGNAGNSLTKHNEMHFTTKDMDNDQANFNCAEEWESAWWYSDCFESDLNGPYNRNPIISSNDAGVIWEKFRGFQYSLKRSEMKIRPRSI